MGLLEELASGLLNYSRSEPEGLLARGLRQPAGLLGRGLNNAINMPGPGLLAQQDAFFRPSVMNTPEQTRAQGAVFLQNIASGPLGFAPLGWTAFHGSPHKFDKFSMDKIGTGEGAQAYGHGLYFADRETVAKSYRDALGGQWMLDGAAYSQLPREKKSIVEGIATRMKDGMSEADAVKHYLTQTEQGLAQAQRNLIEAQQNVGKTVDLGESWGKMRHFTYTPDMVTDAAKSLNEMQKVLNEIKGYKPGSVQKSPGHLYRVDIDDARAPKEAFLDWDKPLSQQSESVRKALEPIRKNFTGRVGDYMTGEQFYQYMQNIVSATGGGGQAKVSQMLREAGIPGLRYLDAGSRTSGGTYNTVLFDDSLVKVLGRE